MPGIIHILNQTPRQPGDGPIALVIAPTRELAQQIQMVADDFGKSLNIQNTVVFGGTTTKSHLSDIQVGVDLVVATPGRLIALLRRTSLNLRRCSYLVVDEGNFHFDHFILICFSIEKCVPFNS